MRQFWKRRGEQGEWPEPRTEFLNSLADDIRETRGKQPFRELRLALVVAAIVALLVPLAAFAGRGQSDRARDTVTAVVSILDVTTRSNENASRGGGDDDDDNGGGGGGGGGDDDDDDNGGGGGGGGDDDDDDNGGGGGGGDDDDDDNGGPGYDDDDDDNGDDDDDNGEDYDEDKCDDFGKRRSALAHHQNAERSALRQHQNTSHPGLSQRQRQEHFKEEKVMLFFHQQAERKQLKDECGIGDGDDDDDDDDGGGGGDDDDD